MKVCSLFRFTLVGLIAITNSACSSSQKEFTPDKERKHFGVAVRQLPPEPVYNRLMLAYLPSPLPPRNISQSKSNLTSMSRLSPIFQFDMKNSSLEQTARVLASLARYTSYTSSVIADRKLNLTALGTIDELGETISRKAGINVIVDHANREVRFLANGAPNPRRPVPARSAAPAAELADDSLGDVPTSTKTNGFLNNIDTEGSSL